jgi:hypothetical protein
MAKYPDVEWPDASDVVAGMQTLGKSEYELTVEREVRPSRAPERVDGLE